MKKVKVNEEACIGCGACVAIDPEHFEFNDNGLSTVIKEDNLDAAELINAMESCPTAAILFVEEDSCECKECHCDEECHCECDCEECDCEEECHCGCECSCAHKEN